MPRRRMLMRAPISHTEHGESPNLSFTHRALIVLAALTLAAFISVGCGSGSPQPSPTPAAAPTTIVAISTPEPDVTPEPAATVAPQPTVTPAPTPTIPPTLTPEPSPTVSPTPVASPTPAATPEPTPAPTPEATPEPGLTPPIAGERPHSYTHHGITVEDPWHWLEDEDYPTVDDEDVLSYLVAENDYFDASMAPYQGLIDTIFEEIEGRQPGELTSLPQRRGDWYYQSRYSEGSQYRQWLRWPASDPDAREGPTENVQVFLDEPMLAADLEYFRLGSQLVSNDGSLVAYSTDTNGAEKYTMVVKDLETGELLEDEITEMRGSAVWSSGDSSFYYTFLDETGHPYQVRRHIVGGPVEDDTVVYEETDPGFLVWVTGTKLR